MSYYCTMERLEVKTYPDGAAFAADCLGFLNEKEIENNVVISTAPKLKEDCLLLSVRDKIEDKTLLCGMKDATFNILEIVCYEEDPTKLKNILDSTAAFLLTHPRTPTMVGVSARKDISAYFKDFLNANFNTGLHEELPLRCYICKKITDYALDKIKKVPGKLVIADDTHLDACLQLRLDFEDLLTPPTQRLSTEFWRSHTIDLIKTKRVWLWVDDGKFTSLTMSMRETPNSIAVNTVFTPEEYRGRGYATALVASVVQLLLQMKPNVFLFADLNNPISNKVYMNIGFEGVEDSVRWDC